MKKLIQAMCLALIMAFLPLPSGVVQAEASKGAVPVVMVHGYDDDSDSWKESDFKKWLLKNGYSSNHLFYVDYREYNRNDVTGDKAQAKMDEIVRKAIDKSRSLGHADGEIDIVVHSMGGLITRWYLYEAFQQKDEELLSSIRKVVFIGTPNRGSQVAFYNRVADMFDDPSDYFGDLKDPQNAEAADIKRYTDLYKEYTDYAFSTRKALISYEQWLYIHHPDVMKKIVSLEKEGTNPSNNNIGDDPLAGGFPYRYSKAFAEYVKLMYGRLEARPFFTLKQLPADETLKPYPTTSGLDEATRMKEIGGPDGSKNIVQDRLMSETFSIFTQLNENGQVERDVVTANLFLDTLNREEAKYRYARSQAGKPTPQYITIATKTDAWWGLLPHIDYNAVEGAIDDKRWGLWNYTLDSVIQHDSVVPIGNVNLPHVLTDRHVYNPNQDIPHGEQMDAVEVLTPQMLNPLTGQDDDSLTFSVSLGQPRTMESGIFVIKPKSADDEGVFDISIRSQYYGAQGIYVLGRDEEGMIKHVSRFNSCSECSGFSANVSMDLGKYADYVILNPDSDDASRSNDLFNDHIRYTAAYAGEAIGPKSKVVLTPIRDEQGIGGRNITIRATDSATGEPIQDLAAEDFTVDGTGKYYVDRDQTAAISRTGSLAVVLDYSGSMEGLPLAQSKQGAEQFMLNLPEAINLGVYGFNSETHGLADFSLDHRTASASVHTDLSGGTAIYDAIENVVADLIDQPGERSILLMTDGADSDSGTSMDSALELAALHNVKIHVVGLGRVDVKVLSTIAERTGGMLFFTADPGQLASIYERIATAQTTTYDIIMPSNARDGDKDVSIGLRGDDQSTVTIRKHHSEASEPEEQEDGLNQIVRRLTLGWWSWK